MDLEGATRQGILAHLGALGVPAGDEEYLRWKGYVEPHEALYVGDEPITDAVAARDAGLRSIWLDRGGKFSTLPEDVRLRLEGVEICSDLSFIPASLSV